MPMIYETDTSDLQRSAGVAATVFKEYQDRADRLRSQANQEDLAQQQLDLSRERLALSREQFERSGGIAERGFNQDEADAGFFRKLAIENGATPDEVAGMSAQGAREAANVLLYRNKFKKSAEGVADLADQIFSSLGLDPQPEEVTAPGVQTVGAEQAAVSPQRAMIQSMLESAETVDDLEKVRGVLYGMVQAKHEGELEMQQRLQTTQLLSPMVETMSAELDNKRGAGLRASLELYQMGEVKLTDVMKQFHEAAEFIDKKNDPESNEDIDPITQARIRSIQDDRFMTQDQKDAKLLDLRRELSGGGGDASAPAPAEQSQAEPSTETMSRRELVKTLGKDAVDSIISDAGDVDSSRRVDFVVNRVSRLAAEKGLSDEQIADIAFSILNRKASDGGTLVGATLKMNSTTAPVGHLVDRVFGD